MTPEELKARKAENQEAAEAFVVRANAQMAQLMEQVEQQKAMIHKQLGAFEGANLLIDELIHKAEATQSAN